jgi:hypothetical protein
LTGVPRSTFHPGVSLNQTTKGGVWSVMFRDPYTRDAKGKPKQANRSTETDDFDKATGIARQLAEAIKAEPEYVRDD